MKTEKEIIEARDAQWEQEVLARAAALAMTLKVTEGTAEDGEGLRTLCRHFARNLVELTEKGPRPLPEKEKSDV